MRRAIIILASISLFFISCSKDETITNSINSNLKKEIPIYDGDKVIGYANAVEFMIATENELKTLQEKGWLPSGEIESRTQTCEWSDGGGAIECDGGECRVVFYKNGKTGTTRAGIGCFVDGEIDHAGAFR